MAIGDSSTTRNISIKVDTSGSADLKALANSMGGLNKSVADVSKTLGFLRNAFLGMFAAIGIKGLADFSDTMLTLEGRIATVTGNTEKADEVLGKLLTVANRTKSPIDALADTYLKLAQNFESAHLSSGALIDITEVLTNTFRLSGKSSEEAGASAQRLGQALARGAISGREYRAVITQNAVLQQSLSKALGLSAAGLKKFADAGGLTARTTLGGLAKVADEINAKAGTLGQTFGQTLTIAMNDLKLKILEVNKQFDLSGKFASALGITLNNMTLIITAMALTALPSLIAAIRSLAASTALINPYVALFAALALGIAVVIDHLDELKQAFNDSFGEAGLRRLQNLNKELERLKTHSTGTALDLGGPALIAQIDTIEGKIKDLEKTRADFLRQSLTDRKRLDDAASSDQTKRTKEISGIKTNDDDVTRVALLLKLNAAFEAGKISLAQYYTQLEKIDKHENLRLFKDGQKDVLKFKEELDALNLKELNRELASGKINFEQFNEQLNTTGIAKLNDDLAAGKINLYEYDAGLNKISTHFNRNSAIRQGSEDYIKSIGTTSTQVAAAITSTFDRLGDSIQEFTKTGTANFTQFAQGVLDDLEKIIIRSQIIAPLANGLLNGFSPNTYSAQPSTISAGRATPAFAKGGVFDGITPFTFGASKMGVLGEKGPEAVVPLSRDGSGNLGIKATTSPVNVNITNNSGGRVEQSESTDSNGNKAIDIIIHGKVKEGFASGRYDKTMQAAYGLNRRGS